MEPVNGRIPQREPQSHMPVALNLVSSEKEQVIIGSACKDLEFAEEAARILEANEFWFERNRYMFMAVSYVATETHEPPDPVTITKVANNFAKRDGQPFRFPIDGSEIAALPCDVPAARGAISVIKSDAVHRQMSSFAEWLVRELPFSTNAAAMVAEAAQRFENIKPKRMTSSVTLGTELIDLIAQTVDMKIQLSKQGRLLAPTYPWETWNKRLKPPASGKIHIFGAPDGGGKCLGRGTKVLKFDGTLVEVENVKPGDLLMGPDSKPRTVLSLARGQDQMYWIRQKGGIDYRVNSQHILSFLERKEITKGRKKIGVRKIYREMSVEDMLKKWTPMHLRRYVQGFKVPVEFPEQEVVFPPYLLGLWLGDGSAGTDNFQITTADEEVVYCMEEYANGLRFEDGKNTFQARLRYHAKPGNAASTISLGFGRGGNKQTAGFRENAPAYQLRSLGVYDNKRVPELYKANSVSVRMDVLAGMIDSDGFYKADSKLFEICNTNGDLIKDIKFIADSLGYRTSLVFRQTRDQNGRGLPSWRLCIMGDIERIPTRIARKQATPRCINKDWRCSSFEIEKDIVDDYYGFQLDGDGLFLLEDMTVTHNSSVARAIAIHWAKQGFASVLVHNEDTQEEILMKILCTEARIPLEVIENGTASPAQLQELIETQKHMKSWLPNLHMVDGTEMSSIDALNELVSMRKEGRCDIVLLDYMGAFKTTRGQGNMQEWQKVVDDCSRFVMFSGKYKVPVCTMAQGTKEMLEPGVTLTRRHLMGGAQFYHKAQTVVLSTRETCVEPFTDNHKRIIAEIGEQSPTMVSAIDKQNSGPKGKMVQYFNGRFFQITDKPWWD